MLVTNTPSERVDYPFDINVIYGGDRSTVEILPSHLNPRATAKIRITSPDGSVLERKLAFDLNRYFTSIETAETGKYHVEVTYTYGTHSFSAKSYFEIPYCPEYDSFTAYDITSVHSFVRGAGAVYTQDEAIDLAINKNEVDTYEYSYRIPLLIFGIVKFRLIFVSRKTFGISLQ